MQKLAFIIRWPILRKCCVEAESWVSGCARQILWSGLRETNDCWLKAETGYILKKSIFDGGIDDAKVSIFVVATAMYDLDIPTGFGQFLNDIKCYWTASLTR
jgi:hypothetical protein